MDFVKAKAYILKRLTTELAPSLLYHSIEHTKSVYESTSLLAGTEGVTGKDLILLETAALFHDAGMLTGYADHEMLSVSLMTEVLPAYGYSAEEIEKISGLILVTRLPQNARTLMEEIICDADLDYLGRKDFFIHSFQLKLEWEQHGIRKSTLKEWFEGQVQFLLSHHYFTKSAIRLRHEQKQQNLAEIQSFLNILLK